MQVPYKFVTTVQLAITVRNAAYNAGRIGLDCEGCRLSRTGKLCLVQMLVGGTCYMFDMLSISQGVFDELRAVLQAASITKIMHDCRQDSAALSSQHNITLQGLIHRWLMVSLSFGVKCFIHTHQNRSE